MFTPEALAAALGGKPVVDLPAFPGRVHPERAGVLVPLVWDPGPVCLLTARAPGLRTHGGEISFPGGRREGDESLGQTALRETEEELGVRALRVLGRLSTVPVFTSRYRLVPFVAELSAGPLSPNPSEVARVVRLELAALFDAAALDAIPFELPAHDGRPAQTLLSPVFETGGKPLFGATAHVLYELLQRVSALTGRRLPPLVAGRHSFEALRGPG